MPILTPASRVLLTGFEPFGGESLNASESIARALDGATISGCRVVGAVLPCEFGIAPRRLAALMMRISPVLVICLGEASGRGAITPEMRAFNIDDARIPDLRGRMPRGRTIIPGAPGRLGTRIPARTIAIALAAAGHPAAVSWSAGRYVCNHVFFHLMHALRRERSAGMRGGFIHVPAARPGGGRGPLALESLPGAIGLAIQAALEPASDQVLKRNSATSPSRKT